MELRDCLTMRNFEVFDFDYPIVDSTWKSQFEKSFIDYYYFYEIGSETIDRWKHTLKARLNKIMPYYNELYKTTLFEIDPLITQRIEETIADSTETTNANTNIQTSADDANTSESDYPQTSPITDIPSRRVGTEASGTTEINSNGSADVARDYSRIIEGFTGNQSELVKAYRANILNITSMLIDDLKTLFILVY